MKKILTILLAAIMTLALVGCKNGNSHIAITDDDYKNDNIHGWDDIGQDVTTWDNVKIYTFDDSDIISTYVYDQLLFDGITDEFASVTTIQFDYKSNSQYFSADKVYSLVGNKFDLNPLIAKFAIGTGVIVVCVVLNVVTYGSATPIACFIAGAAEGAITGAVKGAAMGAAIGAVTSAIKSNGNWEQTLYGTVDGATSGYMWGAVYGAITGGMNSNYCFTEETEVLTSTGMMSIANVEVGDLVYSYNENNQKYSYQKVTQKLTNSVDQTIKLTTKSGSIESTIRHPYLTDCGWIEAQDLSQGDLIATSNGNFEKVMNIERVYYESPVTTYNLAIENNHTYIVGVDHLIVHNRCNVNSEYAGKTYHFEEGTSQARKYPNGVSFSSNGYPRFEPYKINTYIATELPSAAGVKAGSCLSGVYSVDARLANAACGYSSTPAGYVWHHVEDMKTMILVPQSVHSVVFGGVAHSGGASLIRALLASL